MRRIELWRGAAAWMSTETGPEEATLRDLFGTNVLPTAFPTSVPAYTVLERIQARNPEAEVVVV